jgi:hypothetical protein
LEKELIGHNKEIEDHIFEKYRELRTTDVCLECNSVKRVNDDHPVAFFVVGEDFPKQKYKIMFVGKTVQDGWENDPLDSLSGFIDPRKYAKEHLFLPFWKKLPFWQCIKEVCRYLWKTTDEESIWRRIAITNLVKCSTSEYRDTTPEILKINCIQNAKFFEYEVKMAQPTHIVFFTGRDYDWFLDKIDFGYEKGDSEYGDNSNDEKSLKEWSGPMMLWQKTFLEKGNVKMRFLRTYHPGFLEKKKDYVKKKFCQLVAEWIVTSSISSRFP